MITKDQLEKQIPNFKSLASLARAVNLTVYKLRKLLNEYGLTFESGYLPKGNARLKLREYPEINEQWLKDNWLNSNKSIKQLSVEYGIPDSLIESRISWYKLKKGKIKYKVYQDRLFDLNDPHLYYLAGLVATDGYLPLNCDAISISLIGESEYNLLADILNYYVNGNEVTQHHKGYVNDYYIRISYPGIQKLLLDVFGIPARNKTFLLKCPSNFPTEDCAKAYILGCFDGDGSLTVSTQALKILTASQDFIDGIYNIILKYTGVAMSKYIIKNQRGKEYPDLECKKLNAIKVLDWTYSCKNCFKLGRKYEKYLQLKQEINVY